MLNENRKSAIIATSINDAKKKRSMIKDRILYEDNDIIICHKPAGIATQTARVGQADMASEIANYLASGSGGRQRPYVGVVHRLDQPVEGILVFAKNSRAAARLGRQIEENRMEKHYLALVCGCGFAPGGELTDYLVRDGRSNMTRVARLEEKDAKKAVLSYEILADMPYGAASCGGTSHGEAQHQEQTDSALRIAVAGIRLYTGRHHQIRVQMSHAGMSLIGDRKYAAAEARRISEEAHVRELALCARGLVFFHPTTGERLSFGIQPENRVFRPVFWQNYAGSAPHNEA